MKVISIMGILAGWVGLAVLGGSPTYAQSEIAPDHFESSNVEPFEKPKTNASNEAAAIRYDGKFTLPYTVQCSGKSLPPGKYSVSLHSDGKIGKAILMQRGRVIGIPGIVRKQEQTFGSNGSSWNSTEKHEGCQQSSWRNWFLSPNRRKRVCRIASRNESRK